jgi:all-trans-retinol 13,14-reductase
MFLCIPSLINNSHLTRVIVSIGKFDAIVIGSGMSGLTTAALLSRRGWRVLVLEQHDVAGGCTHAFVEKGFEFDTGVHYIGGKVGDKRSMFGFMFDLLSSGHIRWNAYDKVFDRAQLSKSINQCQDLSNEPTGQDVVLEYANTPKDFERNLINLFPDESKNIRDYMRLLGWSHFVPGVLIALKLIPLSLGKHVRRYLKPWLDPFLSMTTHEVLQTVTSNKVLTGCLSWCYGDYGLSPSQGAFVMNAIITNHYIDGGAFYPVDGTACIAASIIPVIEASGGKVLVRAKVARLIMSEDTKRVVGVSVRGRDIFANTVVSSVGVLNTYMHLLPPSHPIVTQVKSVTKLEPSLHSIDTIKVLEPSCAMFSVFIGLTGSPMELGLSKGNIWTFPDWDHATAWGKYCDSVGRIRQYIQDHPSSDDFDGEAAADYYFPLLFISSSTGLI